MKIFEITNRLLSLQQPTITKKDIGRISTKPPTT